MSHFLTVFSHLPSAESHAVVTQTMRTTNDKPSFFLVHVIQARILARQFRELPEKEGRKWIKKAEGDKARYQEEMKDYVPTMDPDGDGKKSKKAKKDPHAPKRNMSAYFLYSIAVRPDVKEENPEATFGELARLISSKFKALSDKERKIWDDKAGTCRPPFRFLSL